MRHSRVSGIVVSILVVAVPAGAAILRGGGNITTDCVMVLDVDGANTPPPPKTPKSVDCVDGSACDSDGLRNGRCVFPLRACINNTDYTECTPDEVTDATVDHSVDDGSDRKFVNDAKKLARASELKRKEQRNNAVGTLVQDPVTGEYHLRKKEAE